MQKNNNLIISKILISVSLVSFLLVAGYFTRNYLSKRKVKTNFEQLKVTQKIIDTVSRAWVEGGVDTLSSEQQQFCSKIIDFKTKVTKDFYQCNPRFINCFLYGYSYKNYRPIKFKDNYFEYSKLGDPIVTFAKNKDDFFRIKLNDSCSDVYLPSKKYSAGPRKVQSYIWDNFGQFVYIDKYYVSNLDVFNWKVRKKIKFSELEKNIDKELYRPNTTLSTEDKRLYCYHHGKKLLESRYFDAASFIPDKEDNPKLVRKFPYHWTKRRQVDEKKCYHVYARGCESQREYKFYEGLSTSWIGMHFVLGNYMEYLPNKFVKELDLKLSSFYLLKESLWHEIGKRGTLGKDDKKFFKDQEGVAFRCMAIR